MFHSRWLINKKGKNDNHPSLAPKFVNRIFFKKSVWIFLFYRKHITNFRDGYIFQNWARKPGLIFQRRTPGQMACRMNRLCLLNYKNIFCLCSHLLISKKWEKRQFPPYNQNLWTKKFLNNFFFFQYILIKKFFIMDLCLFYFFKKSSNP